MTLNSLADSTLELTSSTPCFFSRMDFHKQFLVAQDCLQISKLLISPEVMDAITLQALNRVLQHRRLISLIERLVPPTS